MSKYSDLIKEARKTEKPNAAKKEVSSSGKQEKKISRIPETDSPVITNNEGEEKLAGISIKVEESLRRHWAVESKRTGKSMTSVIISALTEEFGKPQ